jgi:hypothetical protein
MKPPVASARALGFALVVIGAALGGAACAAAGSGASGSATGGQADVTEERVRVHGPGYLVDVKLEGPRFFGPFVDLTRFDDGVRGRLYNRVVALSFVEGHLRGQVGSQMTDLAFTEVGPGELSAQGLWAGQVLRIQMNARHLEMTSSLCGIQLDRADTPGIVYAGRDACGAFLDRVEVELPAVFLSLPPDQRAVLLAVVLPPTGAPRSRVGH